MRLSFGPGLSTCLSVPHLSLHPPPSSTTTGASACHSVSLCLLLPATVAAAVGLLPDAPLATKGDFPAHRWA